MFDILGILTLTVGGV